MSYFVLLFDSIYLEKIRQNCVNALKAIDSETVVYLCEYKGRAIKTVEIV